MSTKLFLVLLPCVVLLTTPSVNGDYNLDIPTKPGHKRPPIPKPPTLESRVFPTKPPSEPYPKHKPELPLMAQGRQFAVEQRKPPYRFLPPRSPPRN